MSSPANSRQLFTLIDLCRAIAAMLVVLYHAGGAFAAVKYFDREIFSNLFVFGSSGVEFFFALSGFLITYVHFLHLNQPRNLKKYLWRRIVRIYPIYWIVFITMLCILILVPTLGTNIPGAFTIVKSLVLIPQDPNVVGGTGAPILTVAWSMQYEVVFYALFALFIVSIRWATVVVLGMLAWWGLARLEYMPSFPLDFMKSSYVLVFAFGVISAVIIRVLKPKRPIIISAVGLMLFLGVAGNEVSLALSGEFIGRSWYSTTFYGLASAIIIFGLVSWEQAHKPSIPSLFKGLGQSSYTLYLVHFPLISLLCKILSPHSGNILYDLSCFIFIFVTCIVASHIIYLRIERPILNYLR